jgi:hypothetical protein
MASFDQQIIIAAPPEFIAATIAATVPADADLRTVKENALYILYRGELGYVYFLREQPDGNTQLRFIVDGRVFIEDYFREPTLRQAMMKLTSALPAMPTQPAQTAAYGAHMKRIQQQAESGNIPLAPPRPVAQPMSQPTPQPAAAPPPAEPTPQAPSYSTYEPAGESTYTSSFTSSYRQADPGFAGDTGKGKISVDPNAPLKHAKPPRSLSTIEWVLVGGILIAIIGVIGFGVSRVASTLQDPLGYGAISATIAGSQPTQNVTQTATYYEDGFVRVPYKTPWVREDVNKLPNCRQNAFQFSPIRFSCYILVNNSSEPDSMIAVLGGADMPSYIGTEIPLLELESMTWKEIQKNEEMKLYRKTEVTEITLKGGKDAVRRYYRFPVAGQTEAGFGMQIYFFHKGRLFEITADAKTEEIFRKYRPNLTEFTTGIVFKE